MQGACVGGWTEINDHELEEGALITEEDADLEHRMPAFCTTCKKTEQLSAMRLHLLP